MTQRAAKPHDPVLAGSAPNTDTPNTDDADGSTHYEARQEGNSNSSPR